MTVFMIKVMDRTGPKVWVNYMGSENTYTTKRAARPFASEADAIAHGVCDNECVQEVTR